MRSLKRLSYAALTLAYLQIVFGAVVRISGAGMGCGDHWPNCNGAWIPPVAGVATVIELSHRFGALVVSLAVLALAAAAWGGRRERGVAGRGGVLGAAAFALGLVVTAALFGAATVKLALNPFVIATHLAIAMALLAVLAVSATRAGGFGSATFGSAPPEPATSWRTVRAARAALAVTFLVVMLGALTANVPGAATSCLGFPHCRTGMTAAGGGLHVQLAHRVLALLLALHMVGLTLGVARRREPRPVVRAARAALALIGLQIAIAAALVEMGLPPVLQSLHQAVGTLVWLAVVTLAALAARSAGAAAAAAAGDGASPTPAAELRAAAATAARAGS